MATPIPTSAFLGEIRLSTLLGLLVIVVLIAIFYNRYQDRDKRRTERKPLMQRYGWTEEETEAHIRDTRQRLQLDEGQAINLLKLRPPADKTA